MFLSIRRNVLLLLAVVYLSFTIPANAQTPPAPGRAASGDAVICYGHDAAFVFPAPEGWVNDRERAEAFGVCAMYYPEGYAFDTAPVVMYPRLGAARPGADEEQAADEWAENAVRELQHRPGGKNMRAGKSAPHTSPDGRVFAIRFFDDGPHPNIEEAGAYTIHKDAVFCVIMSAAEKGQRQNYLSDFYETLDLVGSMDLIVETGQQ